MSKPKTKTKTTPKSKPASKLRNLDNRDLPFVVIYFGSAGTSTRFYRNEPSAYRAATRELATNTDPDCEALVCEVTLRGGTRAP